MNMVRAGACAHPSEWDSSGYHELSGARKRYRIIDIEVLLKCLGHAGDKAGFADWYGKTLDDYVKSHHHAREPFWTESFAIGSEEWLGGMVRGVYGARLKPIEAASGMAIKEDTALYGIYGGKRAREAFWRIQQNSR